MNRTGFTLIELLVVIGIMALMVTVGLVSVRSGQGAARVRGATRDVYAAIRHARSTALVTGKPAVITYSTVEEDGEPIAKIEVSSVKLFESTEDATEVQTLTGGPFLDRKEGRISAAPAADAASEGAEGATAEGQGETVEEILFAPVNTDIVRGMRIKAVVGDALETSETERRPSKISVFSNVDYLLGRFKQAKEDAKKKEAEAKAKDSGGTVASSSASSASDGSEAEVSVVWETNGRVDPHQVWVYPDGKKPEDGLLIRIDRFGAAKVVAGDGREED